MSPHISRLALILALVLAAASCGSDDVSELSVSTDRATQSQPADSDPSEPDHSDAEESDREASDAPIPAEPDDGIGDGAEPLPGAEEPVDEGTWHGEVVAVTNCPGTEWKRVQAAEFSFSVPADFVESDVQPIDSEVGIWTGGNGIEASFDYGWYSGSIRNMSGAENELVDYSSIAGERTIIRGDAETMIGVYFGEVNQGEFEGITDKLSMLVRFPDVNDEIIGRCIVRSIEWG